MRTLWITVVMLGLVTVGTASGAARAQALDDQAPSPLAAPTIPLAEQLIQAPELQAPDAARRQEELEKWIRDFSDWKKWAEQWSNKREPGWFSEYRQRRQRPDPPDWLFDRCDDWLEDSGPVGEACALLEEWRDDGTPQAVKLSATASAPEEEPKKTIWWEHVHLDVGWPALQSGVTLYGLVGTHATTSVAGRLEVFVAPGAMLLNVPTRNGGRAWKMATNYGIGYRLGQFTLPGNRRALLHVNLAKAWLLDAGPDVQTRSTDFVGFSMTFKKRP
jgi:hypothetical protein